jgi:Spy/CpxP family protein refolding chaperone
MKKQTLLLVGVMVVTTALLTSTAMARSGKGMGLHNGMPRIMANLDLTTDQLQTLNKHKIASHRQMIKLRAQIEETRVDLEEAMDEATPDQKKIEKIAARLGDLHKETVLQHADSIIFFKSILTPEQKKKLESSMVMRGGLEGGWGMGYRHHKPRAGQGRD